LVGDEEGGAGCDECDDAGEEGKGDLGDNFREDTSPIETSLSFPEWLCSVD